MTIKNNLIDRADEWLEENGEGFTNRPTRGMKLIRDMRNHIVSEKEGADLSKWQPIETAPKDGTHILVGCFNEVNDWCGSDFWVSNGWANNRRAGKLLTHWMPYPPMPIKRSGGQDEK